MYYLFPSLDPFRDPLPLRPGYLKEHSLNFVPSLGRFPSPYAVFLFCSAGKGLIRSHSQEFSIAAGQVLFLPPNTPFVLEAASRRAPVFQELGITGSLLMPIVTAMNLTQPITLSCPEFSPFFNHLRFLEQKDPFGSQAAQSSLVYALLMELSWAAKNDQKLSPPSVLLPSSEPNRHGQTVAILQEYLRLHFMEVITLEELSLAVGVSDAVLCRLCKKYYHLRPMELVNRYRMEYARLLLMEVGSTTGEVARAVGMESPGYFCKLYHAHFSQTPMECHTIHTDAMLVPGNAIFRSSNE